MSARNEAISPTRHARRGALILLLALCACASTASRDERIKREIRAAYDNLERASAAMDVNAMINARSPDLVVIGPDGRVSNFEEMAEYSRRWFTTNKPPIEVHFDLLSFDIKSENEVAVTNLQKASRYQDLAGKRRLNQHTVIQTETWIRTPAGWKMKRVENVHDQKRWIDGKRVDPSKPYDPDAPPFQPPAPGS